MPVSRTVRQRNVHNENDENAGPTRVTRAKAAALTSSNDQANGNPQKRVFQSKTSNSSINAPTHPRKRAALEDVSNLAKKEVLGSKLSTKPIPSKTGLVSKAAQPARIQKLSRAGSTRSILPPKDTHADSKRPVSASGRSNKSTRKRNISTVTADSPETESLAVDDVVVNVKGESSKTDLEVEVEEEKLVDGQRSRVSGDTIPENELPVSHKDETVKLDPLNNDLDAEDVDDPFMVAEYVQDIFSYLRELEVSTMANPRYMEKQTELDWKMRGILVDWLLEVHTRFRLLPETLFLAVNIIDRFLSCKIVQLDRLQLVGVTAMFIAAKYEEVLSPHVQNFRHVADDGFTEQEILSAERFVLGALNYDLSYPNPMNFLRRISKADNYDIQTRTLAKYLLEISCLDHRFLPYPPSQIAAASMYLARLAFNKGDWDLDLTRYSGYDEEEIQPVFQLMLDYLHGPIQHEAFFRKYANRKFMKASIVLRTWTKKWYHVYSTKLTNAPGWALR